MTLFLILTVLLIGSATLLFATQEEWFKNYLVPLIPVISVVFGIIGTAGINHLFWKKREEITKRTRILDERIKMYLKFCEYNLEFNACTDHIMRLEKSKDPDQTIRDLENKRIDALKGLVQRIRYARIFFKSERVNRSIKAYTELYDNIRKEETKWDEEGKAFDKLLELSKKIESSLEDELKDEMKESQKRRWWQCKNTNCS